MHISRAPKIERAKALARSRPSALIMLRAACDQCEVCSGDGFVTNARSEPDACPVCAELAELQYQLRRAT